MLQISESIIVEYMHWTVCDSFSFSGTIHWNSLPCDVKEFNHLLIELQKGTEFLISSF